MGQARHGHSDISGFGLREVRLACGVHLADIAHVDQEDTAPRHIVEGHAASADPGRRVPDVDSGMRRPWPVLGIEALGYLGVAVWAVVITRTSLEDPSRCWWTFARSSSSQPRSRCC